MRQALDKTLRKQLEKAVISAREIAEQATAESLARLSVADAKPADYLDADQRALRNRLRAHGRQLGDERSGNGQQQTQRLLVEVAYEHWHRMLFARFLEQSHLLMFDAHTALTLDECQELAADEGCANGWELAGKLASKMLPQVFRADSPALAVTLAFNHVHALENLIAGLDKKTFQASDSLGWVYQYWQAKKKKEVNDSGVKIGADELSPVTQLFTEPYMVQFLLDNSLGAWWVTHYPEQRHLLPLTYLRTVPVTVGASLLAINPTAGEVPAAGTFDGWPQNLAEFKMLDPCCGSGHFLVATFLMLVPMRMAAENLSAAAAIDAVLSQNLHGLELDQRCVELAAFAVALEAWRYPEASGYRTLPALNIACVGQRIQTPREQWLMLAGDNPELKAGMARLYDTFSDAPILGSLIDPARSLKGDLLTADWADVQPLLAKALSVGEAGEDDLHEAAITAQGLARAAELLGQRYELVITNVPYLGRGRQNNDLKNKLEEDYSSAMHELATCMLTRCLKLAALHGTVSVVSPQSWLFAPRYKDYRREMLEVTTWVTLARLGASAFEAISGEVVNVALLIFKNTTPKVDSGFIEINCESFDSIDKKIEGLISEAVIPHSQISQLDNPDFRIKKYSYDGSPLIAEKAISVSGLKTGDVSRFNRKIWEIGSLKEGWSFIQQSSSNLEIYSGRDEVIYWQDGVGELRDLAESVRHLNHVAQNWRRGQDVWGNRGIAVSAMGKLSFSIYSGDLFDSNLTVISPHDFLNIEALWAYCNADEFEAEIRKIDKKLSITTATLLKVPFDIERWQLVAAERYPNGLPKPYSDDPTQWIFHGHPQPSTEPLQVSVARLLGYRWPAESDAEMELSDDARAWIDSCASLASFVDDDGIVCLSPVRGEKAAADRLESLLEAAFGNDWSSQLRNKLLAAVGAKSLDAWLRDKFFEQHCKLFHHRPFIWHVCDGLTDGFSALVNYHNLNHTTLERLIYTYLGDWIRTQQHGVAQGIDGADIRLNAAQHLKARLELILQGEQPYDIFVRWKPLAAQSLGWEPDLNDGVRMNIRPFMTAEVLRHNKPPKLNIKWAKDRGNDVPSAPWYTLGLNYGENEGARINDHHLSLAVKRNARND